jgi:hypothetical protein
VWVALAGYEELTIELQEKGALALESLLHMLKNRFSTTETHHFCQARYRDILLNRSVEIGFTCLRPYYTAAVLCDHEKY